MARPVHATLLLLLATACLLLQASDCARPSPARPAVHRDGADESPAPPRLRDAGAEARRATTGPVDAEDGGDGVGRGSPSLPWQRRAPLVVRALLLRSSKLARRFLAVEGSDSAAGASCHSFNVHNNCPPPSKR
ncbi:hypothetical protein ACP4OV_001742 [Aristida adscensionis]